MLLLTSRVALCFKLAMDAVEIENLGKAFLLAASYSETCNIELFNRKAFAFQCYVRSRVSRTYSRELCVQENYVTVVESFVNYIEVALHLNSLLANKYPMLPLL